MSLLYPISAKRAFCAFSTNICDGSGPVLIFAVSAGWTHNENILAAAGCIHIGTKFVVRVPQCGNFRVSNRYQRLFRRSCIIRSSGFFDPFFGASRTSGTNLSGSANKSNRRMPFTVFAVPAVLADKVHMFRTSGRYASRRECIERRMPLRCNFRMHRSYVIHTLHEDSSGTHRTSSVRLTSTRYRRIPFAIFAVPAHRADKGDFAAAAASHLLRRHGVSSRMPHFGNARAFLSYGTSALVAPPLKVFQGKITPRLLRMFSDFVMFTAVL